MGAEVEQIADGMRKAIGGNSGLNATLKFDFEDDGSIYIDGQSTPNTVSTENKPADCTITVSLDAFKKMVSRELDGTTAFMQGKLKVAGDMSVAMKLGPILVAKGPIRAKRRPEAEGAETPSKRTSPSDHVQFTAHEIPSARTSNKKSVDDPIQVAMQEISPAETKPPDNFNTYFWTVVVIVLILWLWLSYDPRRAAYDDRPGGGGCDRWQDGC